MAGGERQAGAAINTFGELLDALIDLEGISVSELGDAIGRHHTIIRCWLHNTLAPTIDAIAAIAKVLDVAFVFEPHGPDAGWSYIDRNPAQARGAESAKSS